jgi:uncharacterized protein
MSEGKFVIGATSNGQWRFTLKSAGNGEPVLHSETYHNYDDALGGIGSVRSNAPIDAHYERRTSQRLEPYFVLKAGNGLVIGTSEMYTTTAGMEAGIRWMKANAFGAPVVSAPPLVDLAAFAGSLGNGPRRW